MFACGTGHHKPILFRIRFQVSKVFVFYICLGSAANKSLIDFFSFTFILTFSVGSLSLTLQALAKKKDLWYTVYKRMITQQWFCKQTWSNCLNKVIPVKMKFAFLMTCERQEVGLGLTWSFSVTHCTLWHEAVHPYVILHVKLHTIIITVLFLVYFLIYSQ